MKKVADGVNETMIGVAVVSLTSTKYVVDIVVVKSLVKLKNLILSVYQDFSNAEFQFLSGSDVLHDFDSTSEVTISSSIYPLAGGSTLYEVRVRENGDV